MSNDLTKAIYKLKPNAEFSFTNNDYSTVKWDVLDGEAPTQAEIDDAIKSIKKDEKAEAKTKEATKSAILERIGLTADELQTIIG